MTKYIRKTIRFSEDEYQTIELKLVKNNLDFSTFARKALLNQKINFPIEMEVLYKLNSINNLLELIAKDIHNSELKDSRLLFIQLVQIENKMCELL